MGNADGRESRENNEESGIMKAIEKQLNEIDRVEREIKRTKSWKRRKDLERYRKRLKKELRTYIYYQSDKNA